MILRVIRDAYLLARAGEAVEDLRIHTGDLLVQVKPEVAAQLVRAGVARLEGAPGEA